MEKTEALIEALLVNVASFACSAGAVKHPDTGRVMGENEIITFIKEQANVLMADSQPETLEPPTPVTVAPALFPSEFTDLKAAAVALHDGGLPSLAYRLDAIIVKLGAHLL